jgi:hypothetical protein
MKNHIRWTVCLALIVTGFSILCAREGDVIVLGSLPSGVDHIIEGRTYLIPLPKRFGLEVDKSSLTLQLHDVSTGMSTLVSDEVIEDTYLRWVVNPSESGLKRLIMVDTKSNVIVDVSSAYFVIRKQLPVQQSLGDWRSTASIFDGKVMVSSAEQLLHVIQCESESSGELLQMDAFTYDGRWLCRYTVGDIRLGKAIDAMLTSIARERYVMLRLEFEKAVAQIALIR